MNLETLAVAGLVLAAIPAGLFLFNLALYRRAPRFGAPAESVSVLIPARNEERTIRRAVESVLASRGVDLEVVVMDDHSEDRTAEIVRALADRDPRVVHCFTRLASCLSSRFSGTRCLSGFRATQSRGRDGNRSKADRRGKP